MKLTRHLLTTALILTLSPLPAVAQGNACKHKAEINGWIVDGSASGVEVYTTDEILAFALPQGFKLSGIKGLTLWQDKADGPSITMRIPLMLDPNGQEVPLDLLRAAPMKTVFAESISSNPYSRSIIQENITAENGMYTISGQNYVNLGFLSGKSGAISVDFMFQQPGSFPPKDFIQARILAAPLREGFDLWKAWDGWRTSGCDPDARPN